MSNKKSMTEVICFTGSQGSGKTTMMRELASDLRKKGKTVIMGYEGIKTSISREAQEKGFPINEKTNWVTQYYIACKYMVADIETRKLADTYETDYIILDRSVLDSIPYVIVADAIYHGEKKMIKEMLFKHFELFPALLIKCDPLNDIKPDGARSTSQMFQMKVEEQFNEMVKIINQRMGPFFNLENKYNHW